VVVRRVSLVVRRRAGIAQERGEHRDRCRVLDSLRETMLGPGAARIVRAGSYRAWKGVLAFGRDGGERQRRLSMA
jgi:hypothetical protein